MASGKSKVTVHPVMAVPRLVMATLAVNPADHWLWTVYVTEQPVVAAEAGSVTATMLPTARTPAAVDASNA